MKAIAIKVYIIMLTIFWVFSFIIEDILIKDDAKKLTVYNKDPKFHGLTYKETIMKFRTWVHEFSAAWEFEIIWVMFFFLDPGFTFYWSLFYLCSETYDLVNKWHEYWWINDLFYALLTGDDETMIKIWELPKETYLENRVPLPERLTEEEKILRLEELAKQEEAKKKAELKKLEEMYLGDQNDSSFAKEAKEREVVRKKTGYRWNPWNKSH